MLFHGVSVIIVHCSSPVILDALVTASEDTAFVEHSHACWIVDLVGGAPLSTTTCAQHGAGTSVEKCPWFLP